MPSGLSGGPMTKRPSSSPAAPPGYRPKRIDIRPILSPNSAGGGALQSDMTELDDRQGDRRERTGYSGALDLTPSAPPAVNDTPIAPARQTRSDGQERPIFT